MRAQASLVPDSRTFFDPRFSCRELKRFVGIAHPERSPPKWLERLLINRTFFRSYIQLNPVPLRGETCRQLVRTCLNCRAARVHGLRQSRQVFATLLVRFISAWTRWRRSHRLGQSPSNFAMMKIT